MMTRGVVGGHDCKPVKFGHDPSSWALSPPFCVCSDLLQCFSFSQRKENIQLNKDWTLQYIVFHVKYALFFGYNWVSVVALFLYVLWSSDMVLRFLSEFIEKAKTFKSYHLHICICLSKDAFHFIKKGFCAILKHLCFSIYSLSNKHDWRHNGKHTNIITT